MNGGARDSNLTVAQPQAAQIYVRCALRGALRKRVRLVFSTTADRQLVDNFANADGAS